jgi:CheY-like chemotaxis protein/tetratricopeptide (TPR) repeat protein
MPLKILLVDDGAQDRRAIVELLGQEAALSKYALQFVEAGDGAEGLEKFKQELPDLVVTDLLMPRADGFHLCHGVRELEAGKEIPIIVLSAVYKDLAVSQRLRDSFGADLLAKPLQTRRFVSKVLEALKRHAERFPGKEDSWRASAGPPQPPEPVAAAEGLDLRGIDEELSPPEAPGVASPIRKLSSHPALTPVDLSREVSGRLEERPLAWFLVRAAAAGATGSLKLARGKVRKVVNILEGKPIWVESNLRNETLGAYLVSRGVLEEEALGRAMRQARTTSRKLGETLVAMGLLDERAVLGALSGQVRLKLLGALRWPDGTFTWVPGDDFSGRVPLCPVGAVELSLSALRRFTRAEDLTASLVPRVDQSLRLTPLGEQYRSTIEAVFGSSMLRVVLSGISLREALGSDFDLPSLLVQAEALRMTGLAEFGPPRAAAPPEEAPIALELLPPSSEGEALSAAPLRATETPGAAPGAAVAEPEIVLVAEGETDAGLQATDLLKLRDLDPTRSRPQSSVIELSDIELVEPGKEEAPLHAEPDDSGVLNMPAVDDLEFEEPGGSAPGLPTATIRRRARAAAAAAEGEEPPARLKEFLLQTYLGIHDRSFYEILDVPSEATSGQIEEAYRDALHRFSKERFAAVNLGVETDKLAEVGAIVEQAHAVLADPSRRRTYDETLAQSEAKTMPAADAFGAELYFQEGQTRLRDRAFAEAVEALEQAVRANPGQADYHAFLGWALFLHRGRGESGAMAARPHLREAFRVAPDASQAHELAGHVERDARHWKEAAEHFSQALSHGAPRLDLFHLLRDILSRLESYDELEQEYRRLIFRLRDTDPLKTVSLWVDLAYLYLQRLGRPSDARVAVQVAAKLSPGDPQIQAALDAMGSEEAQDWRKIAEGHRQRLRADPENLAPLHDVVVLHLAGNRPDHALTAAIFLVHHGMATDKERQVVEQHLSREFVRAARPLAASELEALRSVEGRSDWVEALALLSSTLSTFAPVTLESLGSSESEVVLALALAYPVSSVFPYVCQQIGMAPVKMYASRTLGLNAMPVAGHDPAIVAGQDLLDSDDEPLAAFLLARALAAVDGGRRHLMSREIGDLKDAVLAALTHFKPEMKIADPEGRVAQLRATLSSSSTDHERLGHLIRGLAAEKKVNLSEWRRLVRRSSARVALTVCGNLRAALRAVQEEPDVTRDLLDFALDDSYQELRRSLGMSVTG